LAEAVWKDIRLEEFRRESGFDVDSFVVAIVDGFRQLIEIEPLIEDAFRKLPEPLPVSIRTPPENHRIP
jgi:hypothetical protein